MSDKDPRYEIENEEIKTLLLALGSSLAEKIPEGWGFALFIFEFNGESFFWLSSADRQDMIKALKEFIKREEAH